MDGIDAYIMQFEPAIQDRLQDLRRIINEEIPQTSESIRYKMPAFSLGKYHIYFAAYKKHIGFYPVGRQTDLESELAPYRVDNAKDSLHFLHKNPVPEELIRRVIRMKIKAGG